MAAAAAASSVARAPSIRRLTAQKAAVSTHYGCIYTTVLIDVKFLKVKNPRKLFLQART